jgi:RNA polymerase sigma factor (sigma-70 family)
MSGDSRSDHGGSRAERLRRKSKVREWLKILNIKNARTTVDAGTDLIEAAKAQVGGERHDVAPADGQSDALEQLYQMYSAMILGILLTKHVPDADIQDCFQAVWSAILKGLGTFRDDPERAQFRAWATTIALHTVAKYYLHQKREALESLSPEEEQALASLEQEPADQFEHARRSKQIRIALAVFREQGPEEFLQALCQDEAEDEGTARTGEDTHGKSKAVRYRKFRLKRQFRKLYKGLFGNPFE